MKAFTQTEIGWVADELEERIAQLDVLCGMADTAEIERSLAHLRAEQLKSIVKRLRETVKTGARRVEITL